MIEIADRLCCISQLMGGIVTIAGEKLAQFGSGAHKHSSGLTGQDVDRGGVRLLKSMSRSALHSTPGQQAGHAPKLLVNFEAGATVIADKAYDTDAPAHRRSRSGCPGQPKEATPAGPRRRGQRRGAFFSAKEFRHVTTRYDKLSRNFLYLLDCHPQHV